MEPENRNLFFLSELREFRRDAYGDTLLFSSR